MQKNPNTKLHLEISNAFARLTPDPKAKKTEANQGTFDAAANTILHLANAPKKLIRPRNFIVDKASTPKELNQLAGLFDQFADDLVTARTKLNADAIAALDGALMLTGLSGELQKLANSIRALATESKSDAKPLRGAPKNMRAILIAQTIATYYHRITGFKPTIIKNHHNGKGLGGPFFNLLVEIFDLLDFPCDRVHYAREAIKSLGFLGGKIPLKQE